jgi:ribosomal-protein-alanine N-acetyltransferase
VAELVGSRATLIEDEEVRLVKLTRHDQDRYLTAVHASRTLHHPWIALPDTPVRFVEHLRRSERDDQCNTLVETVDGGLAGFININNIVRGALLSGFLGYGAFAGYEGRGYMTRGLTLLCEHAFGRLGLHRLEANIQPGNGPSRALARRCGFVQEGFSRDYLRVNGAWRDHERWARLSAG